MLHRRCDISTGPASPASLSGSSVCFIQQRRGTSTGLPSSQSSGRKAPPTPSSKVSFVCYNREAFSPFVCLQGSLQLAADLEYICNSITALGAHLPPALATVCTLSTCVLPADFKSMLAAGSADGSLDKHTCKVMARMRGIEL